MKNSIMKLILKNPAAAVTVVVIAFGVCIRFHALNRQSIWNDEAFTVTNITSSWRDAAYQPVNNHPPLYFVQLRFWKHLSRADSHSIAGLAFLRANSALWGSLSLVLIYFLARRCFGSWPAVTGVAIMALSPLHLAYSQDARPYTLALCEGLAGFILVDWAARSANRFRAASLAAVCFLWVMELYTHYWGVFISASQMGFWLLSEKNSRRRFQVAAVFICAMFVFAVWWPILNFHLHENNGVNLELVIPRLTDLGRMFRAFSGFQFQFGNQIFIHPWQYWFSTAGVTLVAGIFLLGFLRGPRLAQLWFIIGIGTPFLLSYWRPMFLWYRYPFLCYGAFVLLVVSGIFALPYRWLRAVLIVCILSAEAAACFQYFGGWQKGNVKAAMDYVHSLQTDTSIIVRPSYFSDLMSYYRQAPLSRVIDEDNLDSPEKRLALRGKHVIFLSLNVPSDPVGEALCSTLTIHSKHFFPALPLHGITVYEFE